MVNFSVQHNEAPAPETQRAEILANPGFGQHFTDHMVVADYVDEGWQTPQIVPMGEFSLHPAAAVLHYGQEIFEGLKAYRHDDGSIWMFRPERNAARFAGSARRLMMAPFPEELFLASLTELVTLDHAWVPEPEGEQSLYLRPFQIATESYLGVRDALSYKYMLIASPAGAYYPAPVKLWVTSKYKRAAGTGEAKCGGNYAASLRAAAEASTLGCSQVLYTDSKDNMWVEECGTMNFMMVTADNELVTPELNNVLAGVTRESLLAVAEEHGLTPVERRISVDELFDGLESGKITETLACGTAAVITPIVGFTSDHHADQTVGDGMPGPKTQALRQHLLDIQYGRAEDTRGWMRRIV